MANLSQIKLPNGVTYNLKDNGALQLTGGQVTGPVSFGDSVNIDEATIGDLVVNGSASFTNNLQANTINGVTVGSSPKFTDTTYSSLAAASGGTAVSLVTTGEKYTWNSKTSNTGTVTSVRVQATSPVVSSSSAAQSATLNTTISLADGYGDTKNPYVSKTAGFVLAAPSDANGAPSFRKIHRKDLKPLESKTYSGTNYYNSGTAGWENSSWYFFSVKPDTWYGTWKIKFRVHSFAPSYANVDSTTWSTITGRADSMSYANYTERYDTGHYYTPVYPLKKAGFDAGLGHAIGVSILYGTGYTNSAYYRTFEVDLLEYEGCEITFLDTPVKWSSWIGTGTTNYGSLSGLDAVTRGYTVTGDRNTSTGYAYYRYYFHPTAGTNGIKQYSLYMRDGDGTYQSFTTTHGTGATKAKNTVGFDLDGGIYYHWSSGNVAANARAGTGTATPIYHSVDMRYSTNCAATLTNEKYVYIVGSINSSDGLFYLDDTWWTQDLPTSEDGKLYIPIGWVYTNGYSAEFNGYQKPLYFKNGKIREYISNAEKVNGHTVNADVPSGAKFTDTVTTATTTGSGNAVTAVTASNGALTITKGTTFLTSHQDISGKADKSATVSTVAYDSTNKKITKTINGTTSDVVTVATLKTALGSMPASDVYSWAKASTKPTYTASEVGALPSTTTIPAITLNGSGSTSPSFYAPTTAGTSGYVLKSNGSGAPTWTSATLTDTKVTVDALTSATQYYPILATGTGTATRQIDSTNSGLRYTSNKGTTSTQGTAVLTLGNEVATGTANNQQGVLILLGSGEYGHYLMGNATGSHKIITLPDAAGTLALTSQIPTVNYPVTSVNSKTGAVSLTASDVGALASTTTYVSKITTTAGAHSAISNKSGAVSFNIPTTAAHVGIKFGYTTSGNNRAVLQDSSGNLYVTQKDDDTTYYAGTLDLITAGTDTTNRVWTPKILHDAIADSTFAPSYCYASDVTDTTMSATSTPKKVPIAAIDAHSSDFSYNSTQKGIAVGTTGTYLISVQVSCESVTANDLMGIEIYKNGTSAYGPEYNRVGGNYDRVTLAPVIGQLEAGDILTLYGRNNTSGRGKFTTCNFSIVRIE